MPFDFERGYQRLAAISSLSTDEIRNRIRATGLVPRFETGLVEPEVFVAEIAHALGTQLSVTEFSEIWNSIFLPETLIPEQMLITLKKRYRLVLLSNTNVLHFAGLEAAYPLLRHFDANVLSFQVGMMKPDAEIYLIAAEVAQCPPAACLFIDDLPENVEGARQVGMQAVIFTSRPQLEKDFEKLGVIYVESRSR